MRPERLTHLIILERATIIVNASGGTDKVWTEFARVRAELTERSATEEMKDRGAVSTTALAFRARYVSGITLADRVTYTGQAFDIVELSEIGRREGLTIKVRRTGP